MIAESPSVRILKLNWCHKYKMSYVIVGLVEQDSKADDAIDKVRGNVLNLVLGCGR